MRDWRELIFGSMCRFDLAFYVYTHLHGRIREICMFPVVYFATANCLRLRVFVPGGWGLEHILLRLPICTFFGVQFCMCISLLPFDVGRSLLASTRYRFSLGGGGGPRKVPPCGMLGSKRNHSSEAGDLGREARMKIQIDSKIAPNTEWIMMESRYGFYGGSRHVPSALQILSREGYEELTLHSYQEPDLGLVLFSQIISLTYNITSLLRALLPSTDFKDHVEPISDSRR